MSGGNAKWACHPTPPASPLGGPKSREETDSGQLILTDQRDIPRHMTSCSAYKAREGGERGGCSE